MLYTGINSGIRQTAKQPAAWMALLSSINPAVLVIGIAGMAAYAAINAAKSGKKPESQPLPNGSIATKSTVQPLTKPLTPMAATAKATVAPVEKSGFLTVDPLKDETAEKEMLRKVMSGLGKKSAAARARRRAEGQG